MTAETETAILDADDVDVDETDAGFPGVETEVGVDGADDFDFGDDAEDEDVADATGGSDSQRAAHKAGMDRARIRKVATKTIEVMGADKETRAVLATLLGVENTEVALTTAIFTAERGALSGLELLEQAMDSDPIGLGALVMDMAVKERSRVRSLWDLARQFGADLPEKLPTQQMKVAIALARGVGTMPKDTEARIAAVRELSKKA